MSTVKINAKIDKAYQGHKEGCLFQVTEAGVKLKQVPPVNK